MAKIIGQRVNRGHFRHESMNFHSKTMSAFKMTEHANPIPSRYKRVQGKPNSKTDFQWDHILLDTTIKFYIFNQVPWLIVTHITLGSFICKVADRQTHMQSAYIGSQTQAKTHTCWVILG